MRDRNIIKFLKNQKIEQNQFYLTTLVRESPIPSY